ncbi:hypothetical protein [Aestuariivirga sp.]|uniref:hypothetical protein n=1 Tax=Aestuariivirga sp. TaxID=2650926 RepID=UPI0039E6AD00
MLRRTAVIVNRQKSSRNWLHKMKKIRLIALSVAAFVLAQAPAHAVPVYSTDFSTTPYTGWTVSGSSTNQTGVLGGINNTSGGTSSATLTFNSATATVAVLKFDLIGFGTLDGYFTDSASRSAYTDIFSVSSAGTTIFQGALDTGWAGTDNITLNTSGAIVSALTGTHDSSGSGTRTITMFINLVAGTNTLKFVYANLESFSNEQWGLDNLSITAVPLPASLPLLGGALLGIGGLSRMRNRQRA